jgi:hypothetical protein
MPSLTAYAACPACGRDAPLVYKGVVPYCTACGAVRAPLSNASVNMAGKPSRVGSTLATVLGWLVLLSGGSLSAGIAALALWLGWTPVALLFALPLAIFSLAVGVVLVRKGGSLAASASARERSTLTQAVLALGAHRGAITAHDAAQALGVSAAEADALLTDLAKRDPARVGVEVDDQGVVWYRVEEAPGSPRPRMRVGPDAGDGMRVGVGDEADPELDAGVAQRHKRTGA